MSDTGSAPQASGAASSGAGAGTEQAKPGGIFARRFPRLAGSRLGRATSTVWTRRRPILFGLGLTYGVANYLVYRWEAYKRDIVHPESWLVLKVHPGAIVECKTNPGLSSLLQSSTPGDDFPRVIELFELSRMLKLASTDERIRGVFADFSALHIPREVAPEPLGLAQIEEIVEALHEFKITKKMQRRMQSIVQYIGENLPKGKEKELVKESNEVLDRIAKGEDIYQILDVNPEELEKKGVSEAKVKEITDSDVKETSENQQVVSLSLQNLFRSAMEEDAKKPEEPVTIAWADSFGSQGDYLLASSFDQIYLQPSGQVPLTGLTMQIPFIKRALDWLGISVYAETRREFKSVLSTYTNEEGLSAPQLKDEARLLGELGRSVAHSIGVNRFPQLDPEAAADKVLELSRHGPFAAHAAEENGLITGIKYKSDVVKLLGEEPKLRSFSSYSRIINRSIDRQLSDDQRQEVAVVYLMGGISAAPGEFSASQAIKGLREAGEDEDVSAIVLRIDSGGGDVVSSDAIWDAVRRVREDYKKPVVASFGNASASGGYYASACADHIMACESTITGSIGVASMRPVVSRRFFERIGLGIQTIFTGSTSQNFLHALSEEERRKEAKTVDDFYDLFLEKVCTGRGIDRSVVEELAGGRVYTGLTAWMRCQSDKQAKQEEQRSELAAKVEDADSETIDSTQPPAQAKNLTLASDWGTVDVTGAGEMSMIKIVPEPFPNVGEGGKSSHDIGESIKTIAREVASHVQNDNETSLNNASAEEPLLSASRRGSKDGKEEKGAPEPDLSSTDEESLLAEKAHREASETRTSKDTGIVGAIFEEEEEAQNQGPYGRGLIDSIGGIRDAAYRAQSLALRRQAEELIKEGKTMEEADALLLPGVERSVGAQGDVEVQMDLRLVRYPRERTFRERLREMNRKGDEPQLSLFLPGLSSIGLQVREFVSDLAVQMLVRTWSDPAFVQRVMRTLEREQQVKMEHHSHLHL